jgi:hypothetical protein
MEVAVVEVEVVVGGRDAGGSGLTRVVVVEGCGEDGGMGGAVDILEMRERKTRADEVRNCTNDTRRPGFGVVF